jgi:hypothetical protein
MEEMLLSRCEDEVGSTINTFENAILKLRHIDPVPRYQPELCRTFRNGGTGRSRRSSLFHFPAILLPVSLAGQRLLSPELLTRLQVKGVAFHFLDDVLLLDFALEAAKGVFERFALLKLNFRQTKYTSLLDHKIRCAAVDSRDASPAVRPEAKFLHFAQKVLIS